jgi:hypothetical protein
MVDQSASALTVNCVTFNRSGTHYLVAHSQGFRIYELSILGDMTKNQLSWRQAVEGGVSQADFLYSNLYDVSKS